MGDIDGFSGLVGGTVGGYGTVVGVEDREVKVAPVVGAEVGEFDLERVGFVEGKFVISWEGSIVEGLREGKNEGTIEGGNVGLREGVVGIVLGLVEGEKEVGNRVGGMVGRVGPLEGDIVGKYRRQSLGPSFDE